MNNQYQKENTVEASVEGKIIYVRWQNLSDSQAVRDCCQWQLNHVKAGAIIIIVDTSTAKGAPANDIQEWFGKTLFPDFQASGLVSVITILSSSTITRMATERWNDVGNPFGFSMFETDSKESAYKLAKEQIIKSGR